MRRTPFSIAVTTALLGAALSLPARAQTPTEVELARKLDRLAAELAEVKAQLATLRAQGGTASTATAASEAGTAIRAAPATADAAPASGRPARVERTEPATVLTSYGEINYTRPTKAPQNAEVDLRRFVLGFQHRMDPKTRLVAELEVEHAVSSADDPGEVALEQAYVERELGARVAARAGLFLMPAGMLNENHEPTAYYGVHRNFVETAIIPSTWREVGVQLIGNLDNGLTVQGGISTGFDVGKWDATSTEGAESPLGAIHQEGAQARARNLAVFGAINWRGVPGLLVGGSAFSGAASHSQPLVPDARVSLWDLHARWTPGRWDLSTVYARGAISNTAALNATLVGNPTLVPKSFDGWYLQGAYRLWSQGDYVLSPFVRVERFNTARDYADLGAGLTPSAAGTERVTTVGVNFLVGQGVVLKADVQRFGLVSANNRVNLGLGWSF
jgi:hypothetical protein